MPNDQAPTRPSIGTLTQDQPAREGDVLAELLKKVEAPRLEDLMPEARGGESAAGDAGLEPAAGRQGVDRAVATAVRPAIVDTTVPALRMARIRSLEGRVATVTWRGGTEPVAVRVPSDVDLELVQQALDQRERLLIECVPGEAPLVAGVVHSRIPRVVVLKGETVRIEADRELLLRSGRGAVRIREDGTLELLGSRIVATSRGLFRLVGRILRLN
ncbi:MAG: hypothetical protein JW751_29855 [Polyangiaceae bacterium]|nr:hypothetical protein [Polyangiaceae bacterium]